MGRHIHSYLASVTLDDVISGKLSQDSAQAA
jgi:hypothetical protein